MSIVKPKILTRRDLLWLFATPIYQMIGTLRHEGAHAVAAWLEGARVTQFVFWPSFQQDVLYWGFVRISGTTDWFFLAAPYFFDMITFSIFFALMFFAPFRRKWIWLNLVIIGMISPLINSLYNYWRSAGAINDINRLFQELPGGLVHAYFISTLTFYLVGTLAVVRYSRTARSLKGQPGKQTG